MLSLSFKNSIQTFTFLHNFHRLHLYSTKSPNRSFANYLVNSLGFSDEQALSTSTKIRFNNANDFESSGNVNADSVVGFFKQHGFDDTRIIKLVSCYPRILSANVDKTLKPKFKLLQDQGFSGSNLVTLILSTPSFLDRHMDHVIHDLRSILVSNENLLKFFNRVQFTMTTSALVNLNSNIALLNNEYGVDFGLIRNGIVAHTRAYLRDTELFRNILVRVEEELGIPRNSGMFLYGMYLLCKSSKEMIELKSQLLKSFGWTEYDVSELMRRNPHVFVLSEENMKKKLGYLMTELGYKPDFLVAHSALFTYSLEKRMEPRRRVLLVLKEKGLLDYSFYSAISQTETQFLKILIEPFKKDVPGLLELYQSNKGCSDIDSISRRCQALS
ncbi:transcription termination factor MTERF8, chloroplastic-like [Silene latifolia]|uniref:transcription termination factor MTERF8, chloroplastic-like n=1 Tax=Silene latifolia TaxID=37657 RepID=UPI003D7792D7